MKALLIILSATWKFAATFPVAIYIFEMTFIETLVYTNMGGLIGIIVSLFFSKALIHLWNKFTSKKSGRPKKNKKTFTQFNRRVVLLKTKYGMPGIAILTPVLLSIPLGTFLTAKYYRHKKNSYLLLIVGQVVWSFIYTIILTQLNFNSLT
ncbi:hypothetical protein [Marinilabilia rubra]|uniref:Small multi-drug export protein n=1 Tax=Marinilabilia rubra TaxID=2162893 RepID=A0A2U2BAA6_9BACT|nr:hypothetical protein [Marinilabilia rubra]PWD99998.1 hypothetical protein DDZ16_06445 [Marinilabilia rubra]